MRRTSTTRQGDSRWTITAGARSLPASPELPMAADLPARRPVRTPVRRRYAGHGRSCLLPLSRRPAFEDN